MLRSLTISSSALAIAAFTPALADSEHCAHEAATKIIVVGPGAQAELQAGAGQQLVELINQLRDPDHTKFEMLVVDGERNEIMASCGIGNSQEFGSANWREKRIVGSMMAEFMAAVQSLPENGDDGLAVREALNASSTHIDPDKDRNVIIILAKKLNEDGRDRAYDFLDGRVPSDGFYALGRHESPFSVQGLEETLEGADIYLIGQDEAYATSQHEAAVDRFIANYVMLRGGELKSLGGQPGAVFEAALEGRAMTRERFAEPDLDAKPEMHILRPVELSEVDLSSAVEMKSMACYSAGLSRQADNLRLSLVWEGSNVDLDLYASARGPELSYKRVRSAEGWFEKTRDRTYGGGLNDFEIIGFDRPVDLRDVSIAVNVYGIRGQAPSPIQAILKGTYGDRCFNIPITFDVKAGNRGAGLRKNSPYWAQITLSKEIGS